MKKKGIFLLAGVLVLGILASALQTIFESTDIQAGIFENHISSPSGGDYRPAQHHLR